MIILGFQQLSICKYQGNGSYNFVYGMCRIKGNEVMKEGFFEECNGVFVYGDQQVGVGKYYDIGGVMGYCYVIICDFF